MKPYKKEVVFVDAENHKARIDVEITFRNGYAEFTMSGQFLGGFGQCLDKIVPANEAQKELLDLWTKYHLKNISSVEGFEKDLARIVSEVEDAEKERAKSEKPLSGDEAILEAMEQEGIDADMLEAVKAYQALSIEDDLRNFEEAYNGQFASDEEFAQDMAEKLGEIDANAHWPNNCIDWEQAARELMQDYSEHDGYYFRNL